MKKQAIGAIIKDLAIILILGGIMAFILIPDAGMGAGAKLFFWLAITGIPFVGNGHQKFSQQLR